MKDTFETYLSFYGPLTLIAMQNVLHFKDFMVYFDIIKDLLDKEMPLAYKDATEGVVTQILTKLFNYVEKNELHFIDHKSTIDDFRAIISEKHRYLLFKNDPADLF